MLEDITKYQLFIILNKGPKIKYFIIIIVIQVANLVKTKAMRSNGTLLT